VNSSELASERPEGGRGSGLTAPDAHSMLRVVGLVRTCLPAPSAASAPRLARSLAAAAQNAVGARPGLWSRSLALSHGLKHGSMLPAVERALAEGYGVIVLNANSNSVNGAPPAEEGGKPGPRIPIQVGQLYSAAHQFQRSLPRASSSSRRPTPGRPTMKRDGTTSRRAALARGRAPPSRRRRWLVCRRRDGAAAALRRA